MLFFGAGASKDAGVSTIAELVDDFRNILQNQPDPLLLECIEEIITIIKSWKQNRHDNSNVDIEELLDAIEKIEDRNDNLLPQFFVDNNLKLTKYLELEGKYLNKRKFLSDILKRSVAISTGKKDIDVQYLQPLSEFISHYKPVNIFSTNYDICVERFCAMNSKKYFDGFDHEWSGSFSSRNDDDILLYKLHGSITWSKSQRGKYTRNEIMVKEPIDPQVNVVSGDIEVPLILYPGRKLEYSEPGFDTLEELRQYLETDQILYACVIGYSFRDDHIRKLFHYAAERNPNFVLILISPSAYNIYHSRLEHYYEPEFSQKATIISKLKDRTVCLPYEFKKIFPYLLNKYLKNIVDGQNSKEKFEWVKCLHHYSESEHLAEMEEVIKRIEITTVDISNWMSIFESTFQALLHSLYSNDDEKIGKWKQIFRTVCHPVSIDNYHFIPQVEDKIMLQNFGDLNLSLLSTSIGNVISKLNTKLEIMNDKRAVVVREAISKAKLWKEYLELWAPGIPYQRYRDLRIKTYSQEFEQLNPFLSFDERNRCYKTTGEQAFKKMGEHIRQIEISELKKMYQDLLA